MDLKGTFTSVLAMFSASRIFRRERGVSIVALRDLGHKCLSMCEHFMTSRLPSINIKPTHCSHRIIHYFTNHVGC